MNLTKTAITTALMFSGYLSVGQSALSKVWVADNGDGTYKNPVLHADYSDPDAIRVGDDFYMTSSSFDAIPGLPILHSKDLVNWSLIGYALHRQPPFEHFNATQHGNGVWAPAIRFHKDLYYIYYPDPDFGIYVITAKDPAGPWSDPVMVQAGKGLIDPCPLWDDDGQVYLVHGFAGSRAGIKSVIAVKKMNAEGTAVTDAGVIVYDGHEKDPTLEGPKFYKRNGYYYIFAPAGGVPTGWQLVLRSRNVYGPYERKVVMDQGNSEINGPHQGAWVTTQKGEDWFLHFQDKEMYGRVVHLQPMSWKNDWPVIGTDADGDGKGTPVLRYKKPDVGKKYPIATPPESDEFNGSSLGLQWQWQANTQATWSFLNPGAGTLRLYAVAAPDSARNAWDIPNILMQKWTAPTFTATTKLTFNPNDKKNGERTGLVIMGQDYAWLGLQRKDNELWVVYGNCKDAYKGQAEHTTTLEKAKGNTVFLKVNVEEGGKCSFYYSFDGKKYTLASKEPFAATVGQWIGAKTGIFASGNQKTNDAGYADVDWFYIDPLQK